MLIKVIVDNFLSFEKETELTMIPSNKTRKLMDHKVDIKSTSLLKYAVVYGANAAGKSNLIDVFQFMQYYIRGIVTLNTNEMFCKNSMENANRPSLFEVQFTVNDKFYAYGFSTILKDRSIESEWLYELYQNGSQKTLFEREKGKKPVIGDNVSLGTADKSKLETYIEDFEENSSLLFLTVMNRGKKYADNSKISFFKDAYNWLIKNLVVIKPNSIWRDFEYYFDDASLSLINDLINVFDTGVTEVKIVEITLEELQNELPTEIYDDIMKQISTAIDNESNSSLKISLRSDRNFFNIEFGRDTDIKITTIGLKHGKSYYDFKYDEESDGTRRVFDLLDMLLNKSNDCVYIVDEIDRSLHPKLTSMFIKLFNEKHKNKKMQLLFTTHESSIMDQDLFRRDEIWFVERDKNNCSHIYSLDKFKERYDKKLSKAYLEGRYGAIPVLTSFKFKED